MQKIRFVIFGSIHCCWKSIQKPFMEETFCFFFPRPNNYPLHFLCFQSFSMTNVKPLTKGCQIVLFLFGCLERESFSTSFIIPDRLGIVKKKALMVQTFSCVFYVGVLRSKTFLCASGIWSTLHAIGWMLHWLKMENTFFQMGSW